MSRPRDFLITFVTPTVVVGPLACTRLSAPEQDEDEISSAIPRAEKIAHEIVFHAGDRLTFVFLWFCVIVSFTKGQKTRQFGSRFFQRVLLIKSFNFSIEKSPERPDTAEPPVDVP